MRVVYVTDARLPTHRAHGGQIAQTCEALAQVGVDVTLVYQKAMLRGKRVSIKDHYGLRQEIKTIGIPGFDMPWLRSSSSGIPGRLLLNGYRWGWETAAWLRFLRTKADLFIMRNTTPYLAWYLTKTNRPTLIEFHSQPESISLRLHRSVATARGLKAVVTVTEALGHTLESVLNLDSEMIHPLHDGVDLDRFSLEDQPGKKSAPALDSRTSSGELTVLYVGSLLPNRGVSTLIEAAKRLPDVQVTIVGGVEPELGHCKEQAIRLGADNVRFVGQVSPAEVPGIMSRARVAVLPMTGTEVHTRLHASPLKLFEYMASGAAIVASDLPSIREVVKHGVTAHLVAPDDPEALGTGIMRVLDDESYAGALGTAARDAAQHYTWESRARSMLAAAGLAAAGLSV